MQVMIVEEDPTLRTRIAGALAPEGVDVLSFGRLGPAKEAARRASVDILVLGESVEGRLASDVALLAEWRNPRLGSIVLSNRDAEEAEELFDLIPSLQAVLARRTGPRSLARMAIATARSQEGIVVLQEDQWTTPEDADPLACDLAEAVGPVAEAAGDALARAMSPVEGTAPVTEAPAPIREPIPGPVEAMGPAPVAEAPTAVQPQAAPEQETLASLRAKLMQAQERLAALEVPAPAQELPARRREAPEGSPGLLYALPSFLRDAGAMAGAEEADDAHPAAPHPAMLPARAAPRRLHLA